jgi:Mg2+/Co2+ transporter CorB
VTAFHSTVDFVTECQRLVPGSTSVRDRVLRINLSSAEATTVAMVIVTEINERNRRTLDIRKSFTKFTGTNAEGML